MNEAHDFMKKLKKGVDETAMRRLRNSAVIILWLERGIQVPVRIADLRLLTEVKQVSQ